MHYKCKSERKEKDTCDKKRLFKIINTYHVIKIKYDLFVLTYHCLLSKWVIAYSQYTHDDATQMQSILYHNSSGAQAFTGNLKKKEVHRAITLHPVKSPPHMYRLHNYMRVGIASCIVITVISTITWKKKTALLIRELLSNLLTVTQRAK